MATEHVRAALDDAARKRTWKAASELCARAGIERPEEPIFEGGDRGFPPIRDREMLADVLEALNVLLGEQSTTKKGK